MTTVYFIRHAEPNYQNHDDQTRELSPKGLQDRKLVTAFFSDKDVDAVLSSPYRRAVDTVADFAQARNLPIATIWDFRERKVGGTWIEDFHDYCQYQWMDFDYKRSGGESLREVQRRNIRALNAVLDDYKDKTVIVGSHGTALSTIIHYYDHTFGYEDFKKIRMPWIVKFQFDHKTCMQIEQLDLFSIGISRNGGGGAWIHDTYFHL